MGCCLYTRFIKIYFLNLKIIVSCVEILGAWGSCVRSLVRRIGSRVMEQSGDNRATQFLIQKVAIDVQRGNAASVMATIPSSQDWAEFASLPTV